MSMAACVDRGTAKTHSPANGLSDVRASSRTGCRESLSRRNKHAKIGTQEWARKNKIGGFAPMC